MPGFTKKTGGLVFGSTFMKCAESKPYASGILRAEPAAPQELFSASFKILLFSYQKNFDFLAAALDRFSAARDVCVFIAPGEGKSCAEQALKGCRSFRCISLPYLRQESWDALLCLMDFAFVRGEDSFSRACLAGIPFVWHCYPQDGEFQLVKLRAFLRRLAIPEAEAFSVLYNRNFSAVPCAQACEAVQEVFPDSEKERTLLMEKLILNLLENSGRLKEQFARFAHQLRANGNLAEHLLQFIQG